MAHGKQSKGKRGDGQHRAETKEERRLRLEKQAEARKQCFRLLPYAGAVVAVLLLAFALWVRRQPARRVILPGEAVAPELDPLLLQMQQQMLQQHAAEEEEEATAAVGDNPVEGMETVEVVEEDNLDEAAAAEEELPREDTEPEATGEQAVPEEEEEYVPEPDDQEPEEEAPSQEEL